MSLPQIRCECNRNCEKRTISVWYELTNSLLIGRAQRLFPAHPQAQAETEKILRSGLYLKHDALGAHARDELGITEVMSARPIQAALASAASFAVGAALPLLVTVFSPETILIPLVAATSLLFLGMLGAVAAKAGGAGVMAGAFRVTFWGALAMALTAGVGALFGTVV